LLLQSNTLVNRAPHLIPSFISSSSSDHPHLHSFPTRRSSDLVAPLGGRPAERAVSARARASSRAELAARTREAASWPARMVRAIDRKSTRLNSSHQIISYAVFCLKKKKHNNND